MRSRARFHDPGLEVAVGSVVLPNPVMTASGTAGHGSELSAHLDLGALGAHVVKSMAAFEWSGNAAPRLHPAGQGMLNAVGLQGAGVRRWLEDDLPDLSRRGVRVVASIWGRSVEDYRCAAALLADAPASVVAVEVNLSCPNLEGRTGIFAHDAMLSAEVIGAVTAEVRRPCWAKLSPNTDRVIEVAGAVHDAGAEAVTVANTLLGMVLDEATGRPALAVGGGGYSGSPVHPVVVRIVYDLHAALPDLAIIGVGGVRSGWDAAELLLAGASAVQVGTASFAEPNAAQRVLRELTDWCRRRDVTPAQLRGRAHRGGVAG